MKEEILKRIERENKSLDKLHKQALRKEEYDVIKLKSEIGLDRYQLLERAILITPDALIS